MTRRGLLAALLFAVPAARGACSENYDVTWFSPKLRFRMTDANTGKPVTDADFRGKFVLLYFGYTQCPDVCPLTMANVLAVLGRLGAAATDFRLLFVTVDPNRDTLPVLRAYTSAFSPRFVGLRGDPDQLARLAGRYRIAYAVTPASATAPYSVDHSSAIYVFDRGGNARLLLGGMATSSPDLAATAADLRRLAHEGEPGWFARLAAGL